jgi:hypothetical protein
VPGFTPDCERRNDLGFETTRNRPPTVWPVGGPLDRGRREASPWRGLLVWLSSWLRVSPGYHGRRCALNSMSPPMNPVGLPASGQKHHTVMLSKPLPGRWNSSTRGFPASSVT